MRFAAKRVVVDDAPHGMVDIEAPFPVAVVEQQQQQQPEEEREVSLATVSPEPTSEQLASRSGSWSSAVRYLSPPLQPPCVFSFSFLLTIFSLNIYVAFFLLSANYIYSPYLCRQNTIMFLHLFLPWGLQVINPLVPWWCSVCVHATLIGFSN
jgi:hypothetical protein